MSFRRIPNISWTGRPLSDLESKYSLPKTLKKPITFTFDEWGYRNGERIERAEVAALGVSVQRLLVEPVLI